MCPYVRCVHGALFKEKINILPFGRSIQIQAGPGTQQKTDSSPVIIGYEVLDFFSTRLPLQASYLG